MQKVRLGILGVSWWTNVIWPGFSSAENAEVTWIAARTGEKAERFAREHGIPNWTDNYADLLSATDVDAVYVGVPNFLHEEMAVAALANGKHVLQEKPMALTVDKAIAQAEIAFSRGLVLMINQELRLVDTIRDLPEVTRTRLGALRKVILGVTKSPENWGGWRGDKTRSGGTLFEMAIHQLDLARWLYGRNPLRVWAQGEDSSGHDMTVVFDYGEGDTALIDYCWRSIGFRLRMELYGERGYLVQEGDLNTGRGSRRIVTESGSERMDMDLEVYGVSTFRYVLESFADAILTGSEPPIPPADGIWAVRMAESAREAMRTGRIIEF
jgi:predicted dehydrogenase